MFICNLLISVFKMVLIQTVITTEDRSSRFNINALIGTEIGKGMCNFIDYCWKEGVYG